MDMEPMGSVVTDIRALLWQFQKAGLRDLHLSSEALQVFFARGDGSANPMLTAAEPVQPAASDMPVAVISAPHLGLFEPYCAVGERIAPGSLVARIDVLGRKTDVHAPQGGRVLDCGFAAGGLVEYGDELFAFAAA